MKNISQFCSQNSAKIVEWLHPPKTRLEKLNSILICQLFLVSAALLIYRAEIVQRIASWTLICIFEGVVLIFAILLLMNVDNNHKWILRAFPYIAIVFELTIVIVINVQDTDDEIPTVISFLLFPAFCETASIVTCIALTVYGIIMLSINKFDSTHPSSIAVSVAAIVVSIIIRLVVAYQKLGGSLEILRRTKTLSKGTRKEEAKLFVGSADGKEKSIATVTPLPQTKIKKVIPIYGNNSVAAEDDDAQSKSI